MYSQTIMCTYKNGSRSSKKAEDRGVAMLKLLIGKLVQKGLSMLVPRGPHDLRRYEELEVPEDVKEGHFAVFAVKDSEVERFVIKLESLNNPDFLRLLEKAKEEYGFEQKGALAVPCRPQDLHKILDKEMLMSMIIVQL